MSNKPIGKQSEREFQQSLQQRFQNHRSKGMGTMHMTPAPKGPSLSLDALLESEQQNDPAPAPPAALLLEDTKNVIQAPATQPVGAVQDSGELVDMPGQQPVSALSLTIEWDKVEDWSPYLNREVLLPLNLLVDSPYQPELESGRRYDETGLLALGEAMTAGLQQEAIQVRWVRGRFELIAGHRRVRAARLVSWTHIRAIIRPYGDRDAQLALFANNRGRKEECDFRLGKFYRDLHTHPNPDLRKSQREIARLFATNQTTVSKCINMLSLPEPIVAMLEADPGLFNSNTSDAIRSLVDRYPDCIDIIVRGVERLKQPGVTESSITPWVNQMVAQRRANGQDAGVTAAAGERVVTRPDGARLMSMHTRGRTVRIRLEDSQLDEKLVSDMIFNLLHKASDKLSNPPESE